MAFQSRNRKLLPNIYPLVCYDNNTVGSYNNNIYVCVFSRYNIVIGEVLLTASHKQFVVSQNLDAAH